MVVVVGVGAALTTDLAEGIQLPLPLSPSTQRCVARAVPDLSLRPHCVCELPYQMRGDDTVIVFIHAHWVCLCKCLLLYVLFKFVCVFYITSVPQRLLNFSFCLPSLILNFPLLF